MDSSEFIDLFLSESREHLEGQSALLSKARQGGLAKEEIDDLFRHAHSLKGMALSLGFGPIADLAHAMEDRLQEWRDGRPPPTAEAIDLLLRVSDRLAAQVDAVAAGAEAPEAADLVAALKSPAAWAPAGAGPAPPPERETPRTPSAPGRPRLRIEIAVAPGTPLPGARALVLLKRMADHGEVIEVSPAPGALASGAFVGRLHLTLATNLDPDRLAGVIRSLPDVSECSIVREHDTAGGALDRRLVERRSPSDRRGPGDPPGGAGPSSGDETSGARAEGTGTIRVSIDRMDRLLDGIGELILDRERLRRFVDPDPGSTPAEVLESLGRTVDALRDEVMEMRLIPFASIVPRLQRTVRDLAHRLGKPMDLVVNGTEVPLDRSILEDLLVPLEHILRNAIDHGLEDAAARQAAGKPPIGRIEIELSRPDDRVALVVSDDGRGIDPAALRRVAVARRFLSRTAADRLSDDEALMLITIPGFSTASRTTDISGRGVGMDVVRTRVQKVGGRLTIRSQVGVGTRLEIDLPPSITVTRAFLCRAAGGLYAVPVSAVSATLEVERARMRASQGDQVVTHGDDDLVTVLPLGGALGCDAPALPPAFPVFVYRVGRRSFALAVDEILGEQEIVVKPLRHPLELLPQYAGAAILDDGQIALIVDPVNLTRTSRAA
jgi:two-component system chemotaxis sensor kinase CheA